MNKSIKSKQNLIGDVDLIEYSSKIKTEATELVLNYKLIENLSLLGNVEVIGSYKHNLMWQKDIDIYIKNNVYPEYEDIIKFMKKSFNATDFYYQKYEDNTQLIKPNLPKGKGLFIKLYSGWKLDIWFLNHDEAKNKETQTEELLSDINDEVRLKILWLKKESINAGVYNKKFTSFDLYKACVNDDTEQITKLLD